jgi:EmrB/QacA subfamily drug resistance transporter
MARKWWTLLAACLATFMLLLDVTVVNVALPDIRHELGGSFTDMQWVVDAYALGLATLLLASGSLADLLGRRLVFVTGIVVFVIASFVCGLADSPTTLNVSRAVQGLGAAMMFATSLALIAQEFAPNERGTAIGLWGATTGFAVAVGPVVGGVITEHLGWEWIFFVNVPVGLATMAMTLTQVPEGERDTSARIDWAGLVTFSGALFCLVLALIRGNDHGWGSALILGLLAASALLMAAFGAVELRTERPMLDLRLFRIPAFTGAQITAFALHASMFSMFLYIVIYVQSILGYSPLEAGLRFLPISVLSFVVAPVAGKLAERLPIRGFLGVGLGLVGIGLLLMGGIEPGDDWTTLLPGFIVAGIGIGCVNQRRRLGHQQHVPAGRHRHRHRRPGGAVPSARDRQARQCRPRRSGGIGTGAHRGRPARLHRRPERDPDRRGRGRVRGRRAGLRAGALARPRGEPGGRRLGVLGEPLERRQPAVPLRGDRRQPVRR